ncbi:ISL3 family transposase [Tessaracoccus aquimaris]|uniref:ISL3 family transposase n=1 Tax=Tessaracoccus aquimaris TaxID=1332264 RepID=A0A1Q2CJC5_9ACTN|nr:ISL3 family transposase [Tessaracoccus aquimaris]AQP46229.1 ISL3 family transposase [Tessaracoccus aquimaris]AQP48486.1 ISL3 family transposase [Tessaracoccus aquimaris]AQP48493.1 ISL3 family transposase [Tessaracoccus aquimaris]
MSDVTSPTPATPKITAPDVNTFARIDVLGLQVKAQQVWPDKTILYCAPVLPDSTCPACGATGGWHDTFTRWFTHVPVGRSSTKLQVQAPRYRCRGCGKVWRHRLKTVAQPRSKLTRSAVWWALREVVLDHCSISAVAAVLQTAWGTVHDAVTELGQQVLIDLPDRLEGVKVVGVDEHCWRHTHSGDKYVTVVIDLTPARDKTGPARLLDLIEGRSKQVFKSWLNAQSLGFRAAVEIVAMDGFTGYKSATAEAVPDATTVMDPFHVVALAGDKLNRTRQRVQRELTGGRGLRNDPLYKARRLLHTGVNLLTTRQNTRLDTLFASEDHAEVEVTWSVYQSIIAAYRDKDRTAGRRALTRVINSLKAGVPKALIELAQLGRTLHKRRDDILAFFDHPGTSNGPTEAINGRLEHLRGIALGFRNLAHYRLRSLLEAGGFRPQLHSHL